VQIYSDMKFSGNPQELKTLLDQLDTLGKIGEWARDRQAEEEIERLLSGTGKVRCFENVPTADVPGSRLWLDINPTEWSVTNIVPTGQGPIAPSIYSALLSSFRMAVLPLLAGTSVAVSEPAHEVGPEHWLSPNALKLLRQFSGLANKSTGASHPRDRARWNDFVIAAHRDQCKIGGEELSRILIEDENWPEGKASELGILFEYERSLLDDLDEVA
jgi:hypothetical protein